MDKFRDAYRKASDELPKLRMDADSAGDELHHRRMRRQARKHLIVKGCTAAAVFCLCCAGTAAAHSYRKSVIEVGEDGFRITSMQDEPETDCGEGADAVMALAETGGVFPVEGGFPEEEAFEEYETEMEEYHSLDSFLKKSGVVIAVPDKTLFGVDFTQERVYAEEEGRAVHIFLSNDDVLFIMDQFDYRDSEGYSLAASYDGRSTNERDYMNSQGLGYVLFDAIDEAHPEKTVHAVISVNGRDLAMTFQGFDEDTVEEILYTLDLGVYFQN